MRTPAAAAACWECRHEFYRQETDFNIVSMSGDPDDKRAYHEIAGAVARSYWDWTAVQDHRRAYDTLQKFTAPNQIGAVYEAEVLRLQSQAHSEGRYLSFLEIENEIVDEVK